MADEDAYVEALTAPSDLRRAIDERDEAREALDVVLIERNDAIRERDEARAEVERLRERELDDFTVTADELDAALDRAEKAEQERDKARAEARKLDALAFQRRHAALYRKALERIACHHALNATYKAAWVESVRIAREALGGGDD